MRDALVCRLLAYHPDAGFAADPVGVLAVSGSDVAFELVPGQAAEGWARRLHGAGAVDEAALRSWHRNANGVALALDIAEVPFVGSAEDLRHLVAAAFEELLVERTLMREELA